MNAEKWINLSTIARDNLFQVGPGALPPPSAPPLISVYFGKHSLFMHLEQTRMRYLNRDYNQAAGGIRGIAKEASPDIRKRRKMLGNSRPFSVSREPEKTRGHHEGRTVRPRFFFPLGTENKRKLLISLLSASGSGEVDLVIYVWRLRRICDRSNIRANPPLAFFFLSWNRIRAPLLPRHFIPSSQWTCLV